MNDKMEVSSSPESSGDNIVTPKEQQPIDTSALSPPDSQQRNMTLSTSGSSLANSNGKRPIQTISNGSDDIEETTTMGNGISGSKAKSDNGTPTTKTHSSGYSWSKMEDEPGYLWTNKKAQDEYKRATDNLVHKDHQIRATYGDIFEVVENEKAVLASIQQR